MAELSSDHNLNPPCMTAYFLLFIFNKLAFNPLILLQKLIELTEKLCFQRFGSNTSILRQLMIEFTENSFLSFIDPIFRSF